MQTVDVLEYVNDVSKIDHSLTWYYKILSFFYSDYMDFDLVKFRLRSLYDKN